MVLTGLTWREGDILIHILHGQEVCGGGSAHLSNSSSSLFSHSPGCLWGQEEMSSLQKGRGRGQGLCVLVGRSCPLKLGFRNGLGIQTHYHKICPMLSRLRHMWLLKDMLEPSSQTRTQCSGDKNKKQRCLKLNIKQIKACWYPRRAEEMAL